jgi:DNA-binding CsgD family transcriptional regulator
LSPFFFDRQVVAQIHMIIPTVFIFFNTSIGFYLFFKKKITSAIFLSIGWLIYFVLLIIWSVSKMGTLPKSFFVDNSPAFGLIIEFILFAVIAGRHYLSSQKESEELREKLNQINNQNLEIEEAFGSLFSSLSSREKEVLSLIADGSLDKEIANKLEIALPSVRTYSKRIYDKLNVNNRTEASIIFNKLKMIEFIK